MVRPVPVDAELEEVRMENAAHIILVGRNIPSDIEDRYFKWYDEVYNPMYMKMPGNEGIDNYKVAKQTLDYPGNFSIHHYKNRNYLEELSKNPDRHALQQDHNATFYRIEWVWHEIYLLIGSFRNDSKSRETTIVENAPIIHLDGYRVPTAEHGKYDQWFMRWASRIYIPLIMNSPGLTAYNCFKLSDFSVRFPGHTYIETEIPPYVSISYFDNMQSFEKYEASPAYAALKRSMELELPGGLNRIWSVEYQLR
jgi:hypothetical protein